MRIAVIGDYDQNRPSHIATAGCIQRAEQYLSRRIVAEWISTHFLEEHDTLDELLEFDGIWGAPGHPDSTLGTINAIQVSRENDIPYLGT